jgi:hypothetical protein
MRNSYMKNPQSTSVLAIGLDLASRSIYLGVLGGLVLPEWEDRLLLRARANMDPAGKVYLSPERLWPNQPSIKAAIRNSAPTICWAAH